jgi:hypothetical protein
MDNEKNRSALRNKLVALGIGLFAAISATAMAPNAAQAAPGCDSPTPPPICDSGPPPPPPIISTSAFWVAAAPLHEFVLTAQMRGGSVDGYHIGDLTPYRMTVSCTNGYTASARGTRSVNSFGATLEWNDWDAVARGSAWCSATFDSPELLFDRSATVEHYSSPSNVYWIYFG